MIKHQSTAASVVSRRALLLNIVAMAALAAFSQVTAAAQLDKAHRSGVDAIRPKAEDAFDVVIPSLPGSVGDVRDQPKVADGASELLQAVFGKDKNPRRLVYGVASLALGTPVELEVIFEVSGEGRGERSSRR